MKILVVDCYEDTKKGRSLFNGFYRTLEQCVRGTGPLTNDVEMQVRKGNQIQDFVVDWEHEAVDEAARKKTLLFDSIDIFCIGGDMIDCPWHPRNMLVVTLIHMANEMKKPVLSVGGGAFTSIYSTATNGSRFYVLNDPLGDTIDKLAAFPRYVQGTKAYPGGWLDNETGDIYCYDDKHNLWVPSCNIGMFRIATSGKPSRPNSAVPKYVSKDDRSLPDDVDPQPVYFDDRETNVHVRNIHVQSRFMKSMDTQNFIACELPNWHVNADGALPIGSGIYVIAENKMGPVVLGKGEYSLYIAAEVNQGRSFISMKSMIQNYLTVVMEDIRELGVVGGQMSTYLYGDFAGNNKGYDRLLSEKKSYAPTLAASSIASALPGGPTKVSMPVFNLYHVDPVNEIQLDMTDLKKGKGQPTTLHKAKPEMRHPLMSRRKRLKELLDNTGNSDLINLSGKIRDEVDAQDPYSLEAKGFIPLELKQGILMDPTSISKGSSSARYQRERNISFANREGRNDSAEASRQANAANERNKGLSAREIAARNYAEGNDPEDPGSIIDDDLSEGELVKVIEGPDKVFMKAKKRGSRRIVEPKPNFIPPVESMRPVTDVSDWNKLDMKIRDDERLRTRLPNDKTELIQWASSNKMSFGPGGLSIDVLEQHYQLARVENIYEPPNSPDRIKRDTAELQKLKLAQRGIGDVGGNNTQTIRPGTAGAVLGNSRQSSKHNTARDDDESRGTQKHAEEAILRRVKTAPSVFGRVNSSRVRLTSADKKDRPFNNKGKYDRMTKDQTKATYKGTYSEPWRSDYDKEMHYVRSNKSRWSGGHFRTSFGPHSTALPLRKEGLIGAGSFPTRPNDGTANEVAAEDWLLVKPLDKSKHIGPSWKKG